MRLQQERGFCNGLKVMREFLRGFGMAFLAGAGLIGGFLFFPTHIVPDVFDGEGAAFLGFRGRTAGPREKTAEERVAEAREKSARIKGLYMTGDVANDSGAGATRLRRDIIRLAEETEVNGVVIDVKEVCGADYNEKRIRELLTELKEKGIWSIARIVVFKDASQTAAHPEWYLSRKDPLVVGGECSRKRHLRSPSPNLQIPSPTLWQDRRGGYWLDPASHEVRQYILSISKRMIDLGFDELQFDYIRFPSDGDIENAMYPVWGGKTPRHAVLKDFFAFLHDNIKAYKPEIMLSADLFGYVAAQREDLTIGQRLDDIGHSFDYVSFMVYPSHYYGGLRYPADPANGLPTVDYSAAEARAHPDITVGRSLRAAREYLDGKTGSTTPIATAASVVVDGTAGARALRARLRPWLEDFFHEEDRAAGRPYGAQKVRMQIDAAESVEDHGWMLWNAGNIYTEDALKNK